MATTTILEEIDKAFVFTPVKGHANEFVIHPQNSPPQRSCRKKMSPADWDKFEKDIADAFEQVP
jgi:hypothetical protein